MGMSHCSARLTVLQSVQLTEGACGITAVPLACRTAAAAGRGAAAAAEGRAAAALPHRRRASASLHEIASGMPLSLNPWSQDIS